MTRAPSSPLRRHVAVVGAGISGAACARALADAGDRVTVFDKSRGPGGRMSTRRGQHVDGHVLAFDHGAQYFTARDPVFEAAVLAAQSVGCLAPWRPRMPDDVRSDDAERWVAIPGMPDLVRHWLAPSPGLQTVWPFQVSELVKNNRHWVLKSPDGDHPESFDAVVLAMPPEQAAVLLAPHRSDWAQQAAATPMWPCWTLMALTEPVDWPFEAARPSALRPDHALGWLARQDHKPGRPRHPHWQAWVAQATPVWSQAHLEASPEGVTEALLQALFEALGRRPQAPPAVAHAVVHRWRYAQPARTGWVQDPGAVTHWHDPDLQLAVCGDFLGGGRVESAWLSGHGLAQSMITCTNAGTGAA